LGCSRAALPEGNGTLNEEKADDHSDSKRQDLAFRTHAEDDEALWLVGGTTLCRLAVPGTERIQVGELLRDTVGFAKETLQGSAKRIRQPAGRSIQWKRRKTGWADRSYDTFCMAREDGRACRSTERIGS